MGCRPRRGLGKSFRITRATQTSGPRRGKMKHLQTLNTDPGVCPEPCCIFVDSPSASSPSVKATNGDGPSGDE